MWTWALKSVGVGIRNKAQVLVLLRYVLFGSGWGKDLCCAKDGVQRRDDALVASLLPGERSLHDSSSLYRWWRRKRGVTDTPQQTGQIRQVQTIITTLRWLKQQHNEIKINLHTFHIYFTNILKTQANKRTNIPITDKKRRCKTRNCYDTGTKECEVGSLR